MQVAIYSFFDFCLQQLDQQKREIGEGSHDYLESKTMNYRE